jgi:hypothetical protein
MLKQPHTFLERACQREEVLRVCKSRFIKVVTLDDEKVMTEVTQKQLRYFPITPRLKQLFISKRTVRHMRWYKEGIHENDSHGAPFIR